MTATIVELPGGGSLLRLFCDAPSCGIEAPPPHDIMRGFGLNNMGWRCYGGTHLCPEHSDDVAVGQVKIIGEHRARREVGKWFCSLCERTWRATDEAPECLSAVTAPLARRGHRLRREQDELICIDCGMRTDVDESYPVNCPA